MDLGAYQPAQAKIHHESYRLGIAAQCALSQFIGRQARSGRAPDHAFQRIDRRAAIDGQARSGRALEHAFQHIDRCAALAVSLAKKSI
jgi:hypothetical protein